MNISVLMSASQGLSPIYKLTIALCARNISEMLRQKRYFKLNISAIFIMSLFALGSLLLKKKL